MATRSSQVEETSSTEAAFAAPPYLLNGLVRKRIGAQYRTRSKEKKIIETGTPVKIVDDIADHRMWPLNFGLKNYKNVQL